MGTLFTVFNVFFLLDFTYLFTLLHMHLILLFSGDYSDPSSSRRLPLIDPILLMDSSTGPPTSTEDWLALLQKQEMVHQMELEKWHEMLGAATELLRKVK